MELIDARGLSCPEPVILTKKAMENKGSAYDVLVDCKTAKENVTRYAEEQGYKVAIDEANGEFTLHITK